MGKGDQKRSIWGELLVGFWCPMATLWAPKAGLGLNGISKDFQKGHMSSKRNFANFSKIQHPVFEDSFEV